MGGRIDTKAPKKGLEKVHRKNAEIFSSTLRSRRVQAPVGYFDPMGMSKVGAAQQFEVDE